MLLQILTETLRNLTIARFPQFTLYNKEACTTNLSAGKISMTTKHLSPTNPTIDEEHELQEYSTAPSASHSFGLPADKALQALTSVPVASLDIDDRVGNV